MRFHPCAKCTVYTFPIVYSPPTGLDWVLRELMMAQPAVLKVYVTPLMVTPLGVVTTTPPPDELCTEKMK